MPGDLYNSFTSSPLHFQNAHKQTLDHLKWYAKKHNYQRFLSRVNGNIFLYQGRTISQNGQSYKFIFPIPEGNLLTASY